MSRETSMLLAIQRRTAGPRTLPVARLLGRAGEHAASVVASHGSSDVLSGVAQGTAVAAAAPVGRTVRRR